MSAFFPEFVEGGHGSFGSAVHHSPVFFFYNGSLAVFVFFILSGYVLTKAYAKEGDALRRIEARIVRLWIPTVAFGLLAAAFYLVFPLDHLRLAEMNGSGFLKFWDVPPGIKAMLRDTFVYPLFTGYQNGLIPSINPQMAHFFISSGQALNAPVWSLSVEMFGSLLVMWLTTCQRRYPALWAVSMVVAAMTSAMLACFVAGQLAAAADLAGERRVLTGWPGRAAKAVMLLGGVYLGRDPGSQAHQFVGAFLIFLASVQSDLGRRFLALPLCLALGRRSVTIYLTHWAVVFGFGCWVVVSLDPVVSWQTSRLFVGPAVVFVVMALSGPLSVIDNIAVETSRRVASGKIDLIEQCRAFGARLRVS